MDQYNVPLAGPDAPHTTSMLERRSRFLTHCARADSPARARAFVDLVRRANQDASHNCWAYVAGPPGDTARVGSSDDGEPHGTAGRPMLQVLLHSGIGEICAVVSRWFGGIKLGTGGLVRAYQDSVARNLATLELEPRLEMSRLLVELGYAHADSLRRALPDLRARIESEEYAHNVRLVLSVPAARSGDLADLLARTGGAAQRGETAHAADFIIRPLD